VVVWEIKLTLREALYGVEFPNEIHENFKNQDTILLVDKGENKFRVP
jgi:diphosphomevalonate decarboxylase